MYFDVTRSTYQQEIAKGAGNGGSFVTEGQIKDKLGIEGIEREGSAADDASFIAEHCWDDF